MEARRGQYYPAYGTRERGILTAIWIQGERGIITWHMDARGEGLLPGIWMHGERDYYLAYGCTERGIITWHMDARREGLLPSIWKERNTLKLSSSINLIRITDTFMTSKAT